MFFYREKTVSRKLEEILLVYILENNRIVSKERMLEVYFNIIEWGPNVYGIGEASRFTSRKVHRVNAERVFVSHELFPVQENSCINLMTKENLGILPQHRKVSS
jgi:hypothetical protein